MRYHIDTIPQDSTLDRVLKIMQKSKYTTLPVIGKNNEWIGVLSLSSIRDVFFDPHLTRLIIARDVADNIQAVEPDDDLAYALHQLESQQLPYLPVVEAKGGTKLFLGVIHRRDICLFQFESDHEIVPPRE
ncbi:MAG: CBS domain-containing protein [Deltaproteobacteria bacterium]|nr:CBS domain-containing protein [Deltaproteobacteria bacterium]